MSETETFPTLQELEASHIRAALERTGGNMMAAARLLGIDRRTMYRRLTSGSKRSIALRRDWDDPEALRARLAELEGK